MTMTLPHRRETLEAAKARLDAALEPLWNVTALTHAGPDTDFPGQHRRHVFDFDDGLRLIISRDELPQALGDTGTDVVIHVSCSVDEESTLGGTLPRTEAGIDTLGKIAGRRIGDLFGTAEAPEPMYWKDGRVGHWFLEAE